MVEFNIINFDVSVLGVHYNAKFGIGTSSFTTPTSSATNRGPAVVTPWAEDDERSLLSRYNQIRNKNTFINENTSAVKEAGFDKDNKALFTLYSALTDLRTIAEYAKDSKTSISSIASLSAQFQGGLAEVDQYIRQAELDKLILMAGEKKSHVISDAALGKNDRDIHGLSVSALSKTSPILDLNGDEVFTINIKASSTVQDDVIVDLSEIGGDVTLEAVKDLINSKIAEFTTVNGSGETVKQYKTRVRVDEVSDGKFGLTFDVDGIEELSFSAAVSDPALIIAGSTKSSDFGSVQTGTISKYTSIDGSGISKSYNHEIAGVDENGFVIPVDENDEDSVETASIKQVFQTTPTAVQIDSQGNSFVVGTTQGDLDGQINGAKTSDVFLSKYDSIGNLLWSRLLGASDEAEAFAITIDTEDNVIIAGKTNEELIAADVFTGTDSFVTKFSNSGEEIWTKQFDTIATDQANALTVDANGDIYLAGQVSGRFDITTTDNGGTDAVVVKLGGSSGVVLSTTQFGSAANEYGKQIAVASDGNLLVLAEEDGNAVIRKLDKDNLDSTLATYDIGDLAGGEVSGISVVGNEIYVSGSTSSGSLNGGPVSNAYSGGRDGFVSKLTDNGAGFSADWITYLGTSSTDSANGITVQNGAVYVAGTTNGTLPGESKSGLSDAFTAKINTGTGIIEWQEQLNGTSGYNEGSAIAFATNGSSVLDKLGLPTGTVNNIETNNIGTQTSARVGDHFYISINEGRKIKIDIRDGDTFDRLATRINTFSIRSIKASVTIGDDGPSLKIEARNGARVDFFAGREGTDALSKLGFEERSILATEALFDLEESDEIDPNDLGGVFALSLNNGFSFSNKQEAEFIFTQLDDAIKVVQSAHRSLTFDPLRAEILKQAKLNIGPAPAHLLDQLARYQDGLQRVLAVTGGTII